MALSGGKSRNDLRPHRPDGQHPDGINVRGWHSGASFALNVTDPVAGFRYYQCRRDHQTLIRFLNQGWKVVSSDSPELSGTSLPQEVTDALDGLQAFQDVVLIRIPEPLYAKINQRKEDKNKAALDGAGHEFLDNQSGYGARDELRYERQDHGIEHVSMGTRRK